MKPFRALLSTVLLAFIPLTSSLAGPIPATQLQFPMWYATLPTPISVTNAAETILFNTALPPSVMGNSGYMKITALIDGDASASTNHVLTYYFGPGTIANSTALCTNTYLANTKGVTVETRIFPYSGGYSNQVYSNLYTNNALYALTQTRVVGTQTNGLFLTVTGTTGDTHGTYMTLSGLIVEALSQ